MQVMKKQFVYASMVAITALSGLIAGCGADSEVNAPTTILYTSDAHYGIKRAVIKDAVYGNLSSAQQVNGAMVSVMNSLPTVTIPYDGGVSTGNLVGYVDFVAETGDAVNRADGCVYPTQEALAAKVWPQFTADYLTKLNVKTKTGVQAPLFMTPGNHDVSNAIGYYKALKTTGVPAALDATSYVGIYNLMNPTSSMTNASFLGSTPSFAASAASYAANRLVSSRDIGGVHFVFVGMWPDATNRALIDKDLANVPATKPVIIFTHDQPDAESKHFTNPIVPGDINKTNMFENLLSDVFAETTPFGTPYSDAAGSAGTVAIPSIIEQQAFVTWLKTHKNIVAYFHGNDNQNEFYTYPTTDPTSPKYLGPGYGINLNVFRVDSPMKGNLSAKDATKLSFQLISIDSGATTMTVREYLWSSQKWGASKTVSLAPRAI
jgi:hypothetical protein